MAKSLMVQGTGSGVGKSIIVSGLCRIFSDWGISVAPFKGQNMALNSFITREGGEIGRAQALQAEAARVEPSVDMNPILLKASGEAGCQVILNGKVHANMKAREYYDFKKTAWETVRSAYGRLASRHDLIVIEGAGSPAEINLRDEEVVNMSVARLAKAPVLLVGDIDKGGVFASLYGTVELLNDVRGDAGLIRAFVINKFRGDPAILDPGLRMIEERTGRPVIGVIPHRGDLGLHEEDGIPIERLGRGLGPHRGKPVKIVVLRLRYISNFTDFDPFLYEPDVELTYSLWDRDIESADLIIIPGSKNTVKDLLLLRENGIEECVQRAVAGGTPLIGVCGGYQMLGRRIFDPYGVESDLKTVEGIGLLDTETTMEQVKTTCQVEAVATGLPLFRTVQDTFFRDPIKGYEIHMGITTGDIGLFKLRRLAQYSEGPGTEEELDGSAKGIVWGTYIHGIFDHDGLRRSLIDSLRKAKGLAPLDDAVSYADLRERALDRWADLLREHLDLEFVSGLIGIGK